MNLLNRFLKYVAIPTSSNSESNTTPSTESQRVLAEYLIQELKYIGIKDIEYDKEHCYIYAHLDKNMALVIGVKIIAVDNSNSVV